MIKIVINIFMYIFEALLLWYYANNAFEIKRTKTAAFLGALGASGILFFVYYFEIPYVNALLIFLLYMLVFWIFYNVSLKTAAFHALVFLVIMLGTEMVIMGTAFLLFDEFNAFNATLAGYTYTITASKLLYFAAMMLILRLFVNKKNTDTRDKYYWLLGLMPLSTIGMMMAFINQAFKYPISNELSIYWIFISIVALFANIIVFIIYEYSNKNTKELYELKAAAKQEEEDKKYSDIIEQSQNEMRMFAHDMKNHLSQLRNIDDAEQMHKYIDSLGENLDSFYYVGISDNKTLDLIIGKYLKLCQANSIKFNIDVKTSNLGFMDGVDLSTLLNNLLDNSFEAAKGTENAFIEMTVFSKNSVYDGIIIKNSCSAAPKTKDGQLVTTKAQSSVHGIGLKSVSRILKKYNSVYDWKYDEKSKVFETDIAIKKPQ